MNPVQKGAAITISSGSEVRAHLAAIGCKGKEISRAHLAAIGCNGLKLYHTCTVLTRVRALSEELGNNQSCSHPYNFRCFYCSAEVT